MPAGYEHRRSQLEMAELVDDAFRSKRHLMVEAGTGTGKTLAYLIPAILSGRRVVISTATKSLQEQLYTKDIPFLQKHFAPELKVAVMKGRANFLCRQKVQQMEGQPMLKGLDEVDWFAQIREWERLTETGDRAELDFLPDGAELWTRLDARRETCTGQKCPDFQRCFITAMHQRAADADMIIVNHHLFFADLALRQDDFGSILPEYAAVVFDEAHEIEDVASDYFGRQVSNYRFEELARDCEQAVRLTGQGGPDLLRRVARVREREREFFEAFPPREGRLRVRSRGARVISRAASRGVRRIDGRGEVAGIADRRAAESRRGTGDHRAARGGTARTRSVSCWSRRKRITCIGTSGAARACFWRRRRLT